MTPFDLYELYKGAYFKESEADRQLFIKTIKTFDFSIFRLYSDYLYKTWQVVIPTEDYKELKSSGSLGAPTTYNFGPFKALVDIEILQKSNGGYFLWLVGTSQERQAASNINKLTFKFRYDGSNLTDLFYFINYFYAQTKQRVTLCALPHNFLYLTAHPRFVDYVISNKEKIASLVSTDWEPLFRKSYLIQNGIYINDCMIDWKNGFNFHHCRYGRKHFYPLFVLNDGVGVNWLNCLDKTHYTTHDMCIVKNLKPIKCKCGLSFVDTEIVSRGRIAFECRRDFGELLRSHYANLQFIRNSEKILVYYTTIGELLACDKDFIAEVFKDYKIEYIADKFCMTGTKCPTFWDASYSQTREVVFKY